MCITVDNPPSLFIVVVTTYYATTSNKKLISMFLDCRVDIMICNFFVSLVQMKNDPTPFDTETEHIAPKLFQSGFPL